MRRREERSEFAPINHLMMLSPDLFQPMVPPTFANLFYLHFFFFSFAAFRCLLFAHQIQIAANVCQCIAELTRHQLFRFSSVQFPTEREMEKWLQFVGRFIFRIQCKLRAQQSFFIHSPAARTRAPPRLIFFRRPLFPPAEIYLTIRIIL